MARIIYTVAIVCDDENTGAEAASELEAFAVDLANSYEGISVEVTYEGTRGACAHPVNMVCRECRSENVMRDAWAAWEASTQMWTLKGDPFDAAYCEDCDGETRIEEVPFADAPG